jgi:RNA polymerase sigma-70 factor (ECF subfamily)
LKDTKTNKDLLILLKEGDMVAFDTIYNRYCKRLYVFVLSYIKQEADAEGIVQEVFIKIWEAREKIDIYASFESFLFTIAYNSTISLLRKRVNETKYLDHLKARQQVNNADDIIEEIHFNELNEKVKLLLNELTPRQKEIFQLSRDEGFTHEEIAKKLNVSVSTVNNHMVSALSFLKTKIDNNMIINLLFISLFF